MRLGLEAGNDTHEVAAELGIAGVPITGQDLIDHGVDAVLSPLKDKGLEVCQIGVFGFNPLANPDDDAGLCSVIPLAKETGCGYITIGPGNYHPSGFGHYDMRNFDDEAIGLYADALRPLVDLAEQHGVNLTIEAYRKAVICGPGAFLKLHERIGSDHLKCNVDPSSLYDGLSDCLDPMPLVKETIDRLAGHVGLVHIKEVGVEEGFHLRLGLTPIGSGHTDWARFLEWVEPNTPEDSWVILEHCLSANEAREGVKLLRESAARVGIELR